MTRTWQDIDQEIRDQISSDGMTKGVTKEQLMYHEIACRMILELRNDLGMNVDFGPDDGSEEEEE